MDEQYKMIGDVAAQFAKAEIAPRAKEIDRKREFPLDLIKKMAGIGLLGIPVSPEYGGSGAGELGYVVVLEKLAAYFAGTALAVQVDGYRTQRGTQIGTKIWMVQRIDPVHGSLCYRVRRFSPEKRTPWKS